LWLRLPYNRLAQVDSASKGSRADAIQRFAPYYNGMSSAALAEQGRAPIRVLISTDVLSEGLNLQDATRMINYDIHWNPVRLMQRIGRVDRRMNPEIEKRLIATLLFLYGHAPKIMLISKINVYCYF
jgi:superfamily II DNA or RNA helicase